MSAEVYRFYDRHGRCLYVGRRAVIRAETLAAWLAEHETTGAA